MKPMRDSEAIDVPPLIRFRNGETVRVLRYHGGRRRSNVHPNSRDLGRARDAWTYSCRGSESVTRCRYNEADKYLVIQRRETRGLSEKINPNLQ